MYRAALLVVSMLVLPTTALAALNAGVVSGIWFSQQPPNAESATRIFTAVQNQSQETIDGSVAFLVDDEIIGTAAFVAAPNEVQSVSTTYTFSAGTHRVSAYITSVNQGAVAAAVVPEVRVDIPEPSTSDLPPDNSAATQPTQRADAHNAIVAARDTVRGVRDTIAPRMESTAQRVEDFRDTLLTPTTATSTAPTDDTTTSDEPVSAQPLRAHSPRELVNASRDIIATENVAWWRKVLGIMLSAGALLIRYWMWLLILIVAFVFWRIIRNNRIS